MEFDFVIPKEKIFAEYIEYLRVDQLANLSQDKLNVVINGFPYDEGTIRNGGRQGGEKASKEFRECLLEEALYLDERMKQLRYYDIGDTPKLKVEEGAPDVPIDLTLEEAHELQYERVLRVLQGGRSNIPFLIGGSNDQSYCNVRALMEHHKNSGLKISVINIDAHFDVRPLKNG